MSEAENELNGEQRQSSLGVFPTPYGIALEASDGESKVQLLLSPDDAARIAVNIISNVTMFNMNQAMQAAAEREEIERTKRLITQGSGIVPDFKR